MSLQKKTIKELEDLLDETKLKFREKIRAIQTVIDDKKRDEELKLLKEKADKYDRLVAQRIQQQAQSNSQ